MKELLIECNNYFGDISEERCRLVESFVAEKIKNHCKLNSITMREITIQDNLIQPTLSIRYAVGKTPPIIELVDQSLIEIGITAIKMVVSRIASRAAEGALAGGGVGLVAGKGSSPAATTLIGALMGGLIGGMVEKRVVEYVATKSSGDWVAEKIKTPGGKK